ncbi:transposase [Actinomadura sp. NAK00032]|uniref:transposase n=1 Tax=Actinomadura sp. NAK00032 TaxID=2742128 RepID=UPI001C3799D3|nr:transposase [Actinomadura sp. NAK00032]
MPGELWAIVEPVVPEFTPRRQGGGTASVDDRAVFTAIVYVLASGCAWRHLSGESGVEVPTAHGRFTAWTAARLWPRPRPKSTTARRAQTLADGVTADPVAARTAPSAAGESPRRQGVQLRRASDLAVRLSAPDRPYERRGHLFNAFLVLAATITCYEKLAKLPT